MRAATIRSIVGSLALFCSVQPFNSAFGCNGWLDLDCYIGKTIEKAAHDTGNAAGQPLTELPPKLLKLLISVHKPNPTGGRLCPIDGFAPGCGIRYRG